MDTHILACAFLNDARDDEKIFPPIPNMLGTEKIKPAPARRGSPPQ